MRWQCLPLVICLVPVIFAAPPIRVKIILGQVYQRAFIEGSTISSFDGGDLPSWLRFVNDTLEGIPLKENLGTHTLRFFALGRTRDLILNVVEETNNPCEADNYWVEVIYPNQLTLAEQLASADRVATGLSKKLKEIRVYEYRYSRQFRKVQAVSDDIIGDFAVMHWACNDLEQAAGEMDLLLDNEFYFDETNTVITNGRVKPRSTENVASEEEDVEDEEEYSLDDMELPAIDVQPQTTTEKITTQRTTRSVNNRPVKLNSISEFTCIKGTYCETVVPMNLFKDVEDGDTYNMRLSVHSIENEKNWLFYEDKRIRGVAMEVGEFEFRLEARDSQEQMVSAAFHVIVKEAAPVNHIVSLDLELPRSIQMVSNPQMVVNFVKQLATVMRSKTEDISIRDVRKEKSRTIVQWSNSSLPFQTCSKAGLENLRSMIMTSKRKQMSRQFEAAMTAEFNVRRARIEETNSCLPEPQPAATVPSMESSETSLPWILVLIVAFIAILLLALLCILCSKTSKKNKKKTSSEFMSKGLPVVFPEEVDEDLTGVATPMLTREERPPLKISQHENPLYKPPPPLVADSPRTGYSHVAPNQRLPPPYVPP